MNEEHFRVESKQLCEQHVHLGAEREAAKENRGHGLSDTEENLILSYDG